MFTFGGIAADTATSHLAASQHSSAVAGRCLFALSEGALLDEHVEKDGEPCGGRLVDHDVMMIDMSMQFQCEKASWEP